MSATKISYNLEGAAQQTGYSIRTLQRHIRDGNLIARYANTKPVIMHTDLMEWLENLPMESPNA